MRKTTLAVVVALGLLGFGQPAQAAAMNWDDKAGDAVTVAMPSEETLDLVKAKIQSNGKTLNWSANLKKMADAAPPQSAGYFFVFTFVYEDVTFDIRVKDDIAFKELTVRSSTNDPAPLNLPCEKCTYKLDRKAGVVSIDVPVTSLSAAVAAGAPDAPKFGAKSVISSLAVESLRNVVAVGFATDTAPAPEGATFTI